MKKLTVIDGDSIGYICSKDNFRESLDNVDNIIETIVNKTDADLYTIALSDSPYFRKTIDPQYKAKRKPSTLKYLKTIKAYLKEEYKAFSWKSVEADDILGWFNHNLFTEYDITLASIDKDVLKSLPCKGFDYKKHEHTNTTVEEAKRFLMYQMLVGDGADNIKGLIGVGPKKAEQILKDCYSQFDILATYRTHTESALEASESYWRNYKLLYILRTNEDFMREVDYVPNDMEIFDHFNLGNKIEF